MTNTIAHFKQGVGGFEKQQEKRDRHCARRRALRTATSAIVYAEKLLATAGVSHSLVLDVWSSLALTCGVAETEPLQWRRVIYMLTPTQSGGTGVRCGWLAVGGWRLVAAEGWGWGEVGEKCRSRGLVGEPPFL